MDFTGSGTIKFRGCADYSKSDYYFIRFGEGSEVFVCGKARIGILEKIVIKRFNVIRTHKTFGQPIVQYFDTFNRIWFPNELCEEEDAIAAAEAYYENRIIAIQNSTCPIKPSITSTCQS